jgi:hypothetical protein
MDTILEIIKITIPALIVFLTVYVMMKYHYKKVFSLEAMKLRNDSANSTMPLRLQAYERLALFCERISPDNMLLRFRSKASSGKDLERIMILAIKQEYDHNLTQQIYVSESLWKIIDICKSQVKEIISSAGKAKESDNPNVFAEIILNALDESNPVQTTLKAIRKEVEIYFN